MGVNNLPSVFVDYEKQMPMKSTQARDLYKIAREHFDKKEYDLAVKCFEECLAILESIHNKDDEDKQDCANVLTVLGDHYLDDDKSIIAIRYLQQAKRYFESIAQKDDDILREKFTNLFNLGICFANIDETDKAISCHSEAKVMIAGVAKTNENDWENIVNNNLLLSDACIAKRKYKQAEECLQQALSYLFKIESKPSFVYEALYEVYKNLGSLFPDDSFSQQFFNHLAKAFVDPTKTNTRRQVSFAIDIDDFWQSLYSIQRFPSAYGELCTYLANFMVCFKRAIVSQHIENDLIADVKKNMEAFDEILKDLSEPMPAVAPVTTTNNSNNNSNKAPTLLVTVQRQTSSPANNKSQGIMASRDEGDDIQPPTKIPKLE